MRIRFLLVGLAAIFLTSGLAEGTDLRGEGTDPSNWGFECDRAMSKDLSIRFGELYPTLDIGVNYECETTTRFSVRAPLDPSTDTHSFSARDDALKPITYSLSHSRFQESAPGALYPRWGQTARVSYSHTPTEETRNGAMFSLEAIFFLPGLLKQHGVRVESGYERQNSGIYQLKSQLRPRGYSYEYHRNIGKFSVNYSVPLSSSTLGLGPLPNLKRIKAELFYDHAIGWGSSRSAVYNSMGVELSADITSDKLPMTFEVGMRYTYRLKDDEYEIEPVFFGIRF